RWLDDLQQQGKLRLPESVPDEYVIRLPRECEWEKAARYPDGRLFPWGNEFDARKLNSAESGIERTSAVGIFADGASPNEAHDMSGNVWEWCLTRWEEEYKEPEAENNDPQGKALRCLRGGSWVSLVNGCRAATRHWNNPGSRYDYWGFRVVCSVPITSGNLISGESGL
ncbi:MAG: formylglycine-generating enzyme family protein, partial [Chloroflexi bacterium]|nr:formylglycine-generating enzyme family protein [Chloroflexota bacterium]